MTTRMSAFADFIAQSGLDQPGPGPVGPELVGPELVGPELAGQDPAKAYARLHRWSVAELEDFWTAVWRFFAVPYDGGLTPALPVATMPGAQWFPNARLNFAEVMLAMPGRADDDVVVWARSDTRPDQQLTAAELRDQVARVRRALVAAGVRRGDRVAAYLPNIPEAVVLLLATASLGAVFTSCPPEFGVTNVTDRWSQIDPVIMVAVDGYRYGGKEVDRRSEAQAIAQRIGLADRIVWLDYLGLELPSGQRWGDWLAQAGDPGPDQGDSGLDGGRVEFDRVDFAHPLWVLFSSGTTGPPKPIVHGHGGITLELLKALGLHLDLGPTDRFFWFSTTGWMMWNFLVGGLGVGATIVLYDGDPGGERLTRLWRLAGAAKVTVLGLSAPFVMMSRKLGVVPADYCDPKQIREVGSTGAPLPTAGFTWLTEQLGEHVRVNSLSGGTDVCTAFVGASPWLPIRPGEISGAWLGCDVQARDDTGRPVLDEVGELVLAAPMPSMPVGFWGDDSGERYRKAYFEQWPGIWRHGDWVRIASDGSMVISGRSDATLNRGGVRLGTAEFYRVVEELDCVADSLVVHLEDEAAGRLILFVVTAPGVEWSTEIAREINQQLRAELSPRHVPDQIEQVPTIPRTLSGKKLEVPVKKILLGAEPSDVADAGALLDPNSLAVFVSFR